MGSGRLSANLTQIVTAFIELADQTDAFADGYGRIVYPNMATR